MTIEPIAKERPAHRQDFLARQGWHKASVIALPGDASFRRYFRLIDGDRRAMLMDAPPPREDVRPFLHIAGILYRHRLSAPEIYSADPDAGFLLLEDFGDQTYTRLIAKGHDEAALYELAIDALIEIHKSFDPASGATGVPAYSQAKLLEEASLLVDWFLPATMGGPAPDALRQEYLAIWREILPRASCVPDTLVLRDFHIDNLMLLPRQGPRACGLLDFQDAVIGPLTYDIASLIEDARRDVSDAVRLFATERYLLAFPRIDRNDFKTSLAILAAQRHAKVIGIFCRLMMRDDKPAYLAHIPRLWRLLQNALRHPALSKLAAWVDQNIPEDARTIPASLRAKGGA